MSDALFNFVSEPKTRHHYDTLLPQSPQYWGLPINRWSHTGPLRIKLIDRPLLLGLTSKISKATITAIAVPVRKFSRSQLAFSGTPFSASQFATKSTLPARKIAPISPITRIFLIPKLIYKFFQKIVFFG